ncbi:MAG TPA: outer membrane beta-barrel protein, partial [Flavobacterium sp.]|nr:outer membrane beta-barrel protein [Flavobacterium sp.]
EIAEKNVGNDIVLLNKSSQAEERTDTAPFASKGIPAIHVFTGTKSPYHKPEDKADLLDYEGMNSIANYLAQIITDIGNQQDLEAITSYEKIRENKTSLIKRFNVGVVVNLGNGRHLYEDEFFNAKTAFSYSAGLQFNYKLTRITHLNIEGLYDYNASKSAEGKLKRQSVTIPLNIEFGTPTNSGKGSRLFIFAGPYYRYSFDGKNGATKLDFDNVYSKNEWGYNFGIGADFHQLRIAYTYRQAFSSILENNGDIRAIGSYLTLGYRF